MFVRRWMSSPAVVLPAATPVVDAIEFMAVKKIRRIPVIQDGALVGIVTGTDLQAVAARHPGLGRSERILLGYVMAKPVLTVAPDDTLEHAAKIMLENEVSGLPVLDGGRLLGMITESDVFEAFNEIMGTEEAGARIMLTVPADDDLLDTLRKRLKGLAIRSLATYRSEEGRDWEVVVRVCGRTPAEIPQF
ncbi:MAG TPA: CBS domain-containing protein [Planctomycetota bacterium]|nr:CBS domain-containing protein [Planctomycetota bacterium]